MQSRTVRRITSAHAALSLHYTQLDTAPCVHHLFVWWACPPRSGVRYSCLSNGTLTQTVPNPPPTQLRPRLLKGSRTCVHHDHAGVPTWRCS